MADRSRFDSDPDQTQRVLNIFHRQFLKKVHYEWYRSYCRLHHFGNCFIDAYPTESRSATLNYQANLEFDKPYRVLPPFIPVVLRSSPPPSPEGGKIRAFILTALSDFSSYYLKKKIWVWCNPGSGGKNFPRPLARKWQSLPPARPLIISHLADSWRSLWGCRVRYGFLSIWHVIVIEMQLADKNGPGE